MKYSAPLLFPTRFSILFGFGMTDLYWLYVILFSRIVNPVSVFVVDSRTGLHLQSGQIGSLVATLHWSEVRLAVLLSLLVLVLATVVANAAQITFANAGLPGSTRLAPAM